MDRLNTMIDDCVYDLEEAYREMAADAERESNAVEWCEALIGDVAAATG